MGRRRWLLWTSVVALIAAACGGGGGRERTGDRASGEPPPVSVDATTGATTFPSSTTGGPTTTVAATTGSTSAASSPRAPATAAPTGPPPGIALTRLAPLADGTAIATRAGDPAVYVTEQAGLVRAFRGGALDPNPVVDLRDEVLAGGERGLLGIAFSADGGTLYLYWTARQPTGEVTIAALPMGPTTADKTRRQVLLTIPHAAYGNHNGGILMRGPDGFLYAGVGDGGGSGDPDGNGQDTSTLLGTVLRLDPTKPSDGRAYGIPPGNPFAGGGGRPEIWAYGLRNPWRLSFDPATDTLWIADVGQNDYEEMNRVAAGRAGVNYGWKLREGLHPFKGGARPAGAVDPIAELSHDGGVCSITGGHVYRGQAIPGLVGRYVFADFCADGIRTLTEQGGAWVAEKTTASARGVRTFGVDQDGELLVVDSAGLARIVAR